MIYAELPVCAPQVAALRAQVEEMAHNAERGGDERSSLRQQLEAANDNCAKLQDELAAQMEALRSVKSQLKGTSHSASVRGQAHPSTGCMLIAGT